MNFGVVLAMLETLPHTAKWQRYLAGLGEATMLFLN